MCGRAAIAYAAPDIGRAVRNVGVTLPASTPPPADYSSGKACKGAKEGGKLVGTTFPVLQCSGGGGALTVQTKEWGIRNLSTHNVWCDDDKWLTTKTWKQCLESGRRCAVCVTAFAEGITCRQPDDGLFFLAALYVGAGFVILTTDSTRVPLLAERAQSQAEHGVPTRCPLWMDAAGATNWLYDDEAATPAGATAAVRRLEATVRANQPALVQGVAPTSKAPRAKAEGKLGTPDARQGSLASFVRKSGSPAVPPEPKPEPKEPEPEPKPPPSAASGAVKRPPPPRACPACTLETEDAARPTCEACGCELDPPTAAKRSKPEPAEAPPKRRSIESFFNRKPS